MELALRRVVLEWLAAAPDLAAILNAVAEEAPLRASAPWLAIAASASTDWSTKDSAGREVRLALELRLRGEEATEAEAIMALVEQRLATLPADQAGYRIVSAAYLRGRAEQRPRNERAVLVEYRFRLLAQD